MAGAADELVLLERVFLRVGAAETDEQLQNVVSKFLPPVLLKLSSQQEGVRKKVMELLVHINRRIKSRPTVRLPVESLLVQYQDPAASSFVINFTIIYIKMGFPRLTTEEQVELVPILLNALDSKPQSHQDSLLLLIVPLLGKIKVPTDPTKASMLFGLNEKPQISKHFLSIILDMLLLPYGALSSQQLETKESPSNTEVSLPIPSGMSEYSFKRATHENPMKPEDLEQIKVGIVKFLAHGIFPDDEILVHMIVAAADTRFSVANLADMELKKVVSSVDWSSATLPMPLYLLFLGSQSQNLKPNMKKSPASTRIRLKLLTNLCRVTGSGFIIPPAIQIIFDSLYGMNTNTRLKTLALNFAANLVRYTDNDVLGKIATVLLSGLDKLIREGDVTHQGQAFMIHGMAARRFPMLVYHNVGLLETFFKKLETADADLKLQIREGLLNLISAYRYDINPEECDKDGRINILFALVKYYMDSEEPMVRFVAVRSIATIFPPDHVPSKFLLLLATGDKKDDVFMEALKHLYGTTRKNDVDMSSTNKEKTKITMPSFTEITKYIYIESTNRLSSKGQKYSIGNNVLAFPPAVYVEILIYLRLCMTQSLEVPLTREVIRHPSEVTPIIKSYLISIYDEKQPIEKNPLLQYVSLVKQLLVASPTAEPLCCMIEVVGCVPELHNVFTPEEIQWIRDISTSVKEEIREHVAVLYGLLISQTQDNKQYETSLDYFLNQCSNGKNLEAQHGAVLALANSLERKIMLRKIKHEDFQHMEILKTTISSFYTFLSHQTTMLVSASAMAFGLIGKSISLPIDDGGNVKIGSPDAKRPANGKVTKMQVINQLFDVMNNVKYPSKVRERAARSLGLICVGEVFSNTKEVIQGFLNTAKETKDVEVHFTIGESLVMCVQSIWSPEARDAWSVSPSDYTPSSTMLDGPNNEHLDWLLDELLKYSQELHPNMKQASAIWLLAVLKSCGDRKPIKDKMITLQRAFMSLLGENNDIVQDVASKGLCLVYDYSQSEELLNTLVEQLTSGRRQAIQVNEDTKLFEEGQLGKSPTGGNLSTYKELCSLASDLNKPDLIYQFMHLANHNSIWNSKKGAAFGFSTIAEKCGERLQPFLPKIIPKLYRYKYDPTPSIQASMQNIWHVLVPESQKMLELYHHEILADLLENLTSGQYRVRQSCCLALQDILKGAGNRSIHDSVDYMEELWTKLFRVMDDHHEATRLAAMNTTKVLSKLCIRGADLSQGKTGVKMTESILPVLLNNGIINSVAEVRAISLQTISELVGSAGNQLKPFLPQLIPALLQATGELESTKLSYLSARFGAQTQAQEAIDSARASIAKSHFTTETVSKCLQYADATILEDLVPKVTDLMKGSVGLGTRVVCAHFISLLVIHLGKELNPYAGKFLAALVNGLTDRNAAIRKNYAVAIGHLVGVAKDSSLDKLFAKINHWYFEREDDSIRSACAYTIQSIGNHNQDVLKNHSDVVLPLVFFAMHAEKTQETENTLEVWNDIWSEQSPGTETGIRQNIENICDMLKTALESPSWTMKAQAANAVSTVAQKLGSTMDLKHRNALIQILLTGLSGRTWNGKDKLLKALASICINCKDSIKADKELDKNQIIEAVLRECRKEESVYKISALEAIGDVVSSLDVDKFEDIYAIVENILKKEAFEVSKEENEDSTSEEISKKREVNIKLRETVYDTLGKAWPNNSKTTQDKYGKMFVDHCTTHLPQLTRPVQVSVVSALCSFIDKLTLLNDEPFENEDAKHLSDIVDEVLKGLKYTLSISKHTRLRKEALNVVLSLGKKLKEKKLTSEYNRLCDLYQEVLPELLVDHQPEIKSRVADISNILVSNANLS